MDSSIRIRPARPADEVSVRACAIEAYAQYIEAIGKEPAPMAADYRQQIEQGFVRVAVGVSDQVEGFIVFFPNDDHMFLENIAVFGAAAGKGIGRQLMAVCEAEAKKAGLKSIRLYTNEKMAANLSIYPHLGYLEVDRRAEDGFRRVYFEKTLV